MPRKYKRTEGVRARACSWTTEKLQSAFDEMDRKTIGINEISRQFGIPSRTLRRRFAAKNTTKQILGKHPILDFDNEKRLAKHILKLGDAGFPPNRQSICMLAYQFAEKLELKHNFDHKNEMAGAARFKSFIERNPELSIRQAEGLSVARAEGLSREEVNNFYDHLITKRERQNKSKDTNKDNCIECFENYKQTTSKSDWIQCVKCQNWLHETCTLFKNYCSRCGKLIALSG